MPVTDFALRLKDLRSRLGITQSEAALHLGVSLVCWKKWEAGKNIPRKQTIRHIDLAFKRK